MGWQPSRFLAQPGQGQARLRLAQQLGSVNAAAAELGTTWPSLRIAFTRHGLGMPVRNREAVRQRAIAAARQRTSRPARLWILCLWPSTPAPFPPANGLRPSCMSGSAATRSTPSWVPNVVVELYSESRARQPTTRAWAILRRADRSYRLASQRASRAERRHNNCSTRPDSFSLARADK